MPLTKTDPFALLKSIAREQWAPLRRLVVKWIEEDDTFNGRKREELGSSDVSCIAADLLGSGWIGLDAPDAKGECSVNKTPDSQNGHCPNWPNWPSLVVVPEGSPVPPVTCANVPFQDGDLVVTVADRQFPGSWEVWVYATEPRGFAFVARYPTKREAVTCALGHQVA